MLILATRRRRKSLVTEHSPIRYVNYGYLYGHTIHADTLQRRDFTSFDKSLVSNMALMSYIHEI